MAGEQADVKHFDLKQMENFRDNEVHPVFTKAKKPQGGRRGEGDGRIRPLSELIGGYTTADNLDQESQLLRLGLINREKLISGPTLVESVKSVATSLDKLLGDQMELFKELKEALTDTIEEANKTKNKNWTRSTHRRCSRPSKRSTRSPADPRARKRSSRPRARVNGWRRERARGGGPVRRIIRGERRQVRGTGPRSTDNWAPRHAHHRLSRAQARRDLRLAPLRPRRQALSGWTSGSAASASSSRTPASCGTRARTTTSGSSTAERSAPSCRPGSSSRAV